MINAHVRTLFGFRPDQFDQLGILFDLALDKRRELLRRVGLRL